jgi:hypothetical protein
MKFQMFVSNEGGNLHKSAVVSEPLQKLVKHSYLSRESPLISPGSCDAVVVG